MRRVLLATDGSSFAEEAAWFLAHVPHSEKLHLTVMTALQMPLINRRYPVHGLMSAFADREREFAEKTFASIAEMFEGADVVLDSVCVEGHASSQIIQAARERNVDLIVVGAQGHSEVRRMLLGSTSDEVATRAECSVLVVRPTGIRNADRPLRIAVGFQDSVPSRAAVEEFCETTWGIRTDVHVVTIASYISAFLNEIVVDPTLVKDAATKALNGAAVRLHEVAPHTIAHLVESDHIGEGLVKFAERNQTDIMVVGESPHGVLNHVLLGSVTRYVLRHAPCSVWIARNVLTTDATHTTAQHDIHADAAPEGVES
ncbi:universal stress protein [Novipirellula artificiosorum]|uniref:Putative universal stress protein n=1 Tax=Novipirellula artificiosorum TaxID=2528016 RepID=A0A5C6DNJ0_9BACT|nr:universal stress protein [Novipirellula artificiosorum]TWU38410.1 putative universal stress protein [Novipirellula artificiosorum]